MNNSKDKILTLANSLISDDPITYAMLITICGALCSTKAKEELSDLLDLFAKTQIARIQAAKERR